MRTAGADLWRLCQGQGACWAHYPSDQYRLRLLIANEIRSCAQNGGRASESMALRFSPWLATASPLSPQDTLAAVTCLSNALRHSALQSARTVMLPRRVILPWALPGALGGEGRLRVGYMSSHFTRTMLNGLFNEVPKP